MKIVKTLEGRKVTLAVAACAVICSVAMATCWTTPPDGPACGTNQIQDPTNNCVAHPRSAEYARRAKNQIPISNSNTNLAVFCADALISTSGAIVYTNAYYATNITVTTNGMAKVYFQPPTNTYGFLRVQKVGISTRSMSTVGYNTFKCQSSLLTPPGRVGKGCPCRASCALSIPGPCITS